MIYTEMNNLKDYTQFNEGLKEWFGRNINPGNHGRIIKNIFENNIVPNFRLEDLSQISTTYINVYSYNIITGNQIDVSLGGYIGGVHIEPFIWIDKKRWDINKEIIKDIYNYFDKKYKPEPVIRITKEDPFGEEDWND